MKIALLVARNHEELVRDAAELDGAVLLRRAFAELGVELPARSFHDPTVDGSESDAVVPEAAWDAFNAPQEFVTWLDRLTARGIRGIDDAEHLPWSHDKTSLGDLRDAGVSVAPFAFFPAGSDAAAVVPRLVVEGWRRAVKKPGCPCMATEACRAWVLGEQVGGEVLPCRMADGRAGEATRGVSGGRRAPWGGELSPSSRGGSDVCVQPRAERERDPHDGRRFGVRGAGARRGEPSATGGARSRGASVQQGGGGSSGVHLAGGHPARPRAGSRRGLSDLRRLRGKIFMKRTTPANKSL